MNVYTVAHYFAFIGKSLMEIANHYINPVSLAIAGRFCRAFWMPEERVL